MKQPAVCNIKRHYITPLSETLTFWKGCAASLTSPMAATRKPKHGCGIPLPSLISPILVIIPSEIDSRLVSQPVPFNERKFSSLR